MDTHSFRGIDATLTCTRRLLGNLSRERGPTSHEVPFSKRITIVQREDKTGTPEMPHLGCFYAVYTGDLKEYQHLGEKLQRPPIEGVIEITAREISGVHLAPSLANSKVVLIPFVEWAKEKIKAGTAGPSLVLDTNPRLTGVVDSETGRLLQLAEALLNTAFVL